MCRVYFKMFKSVFNFKFLIRDFENMKFIFININNFLKIYFLYRLILRPFVNRLVFCYCMLIQSDSIFLAFSRYVFSLFPRVINFHSIHSSPIVCAQKPLNTYSINCNCIIFLFQHNHRHERY